ncbi:pterin-4-alpha-carbinolamine dehydratase [Thiorhodovibrio frisius]|nr:pterin-4-alpha-carbinolamine dehydratase [Thiorhodovibrio frisius]
MNAPTSESGSGTDSGPLGSDKPLRNESHKGESHEGPGWHGWTRRERPLRLERRLEFPDYEATRVFLEQAGELSEAMDVYPNLSFGRTYANLTIFADEDSGELTAQAQTFAERIEQLLG